MPVSAWLWIAFFGVSVPAAQPVGAEDPRVFSLDAPPGAAELLGRFTRAPRDAGARRQLARIYAEAGWRSMAAFLDAAANEAAGKEYTWPPIKRRIWFCPGDEKPGNAYQPLVERAYRQMAADHYKEALAEFQVAFSREGFRCRLAVEWSYVVLAMSRMHPDDVDSVAYEHGLRGLITATTEMPMFPDAVFSEPAVWGFLGSVFWRKGDLAGALASYRRIVQIAGSDSEDGRLAITRIRELEAARKAGKW